MSLSFRTNGNYVDFVNIDDTSLHVETTIMSLHNTSRCIQWKLPSDTTIINFVIDGVRYEQTPIASIDFDGTAMTVQADFETGIIAAFPGLAGSSSGGLLSATVELTDAQIKALPTTGIEIVAAPGAGKAIDIISCIVSTNFVTAYTNITDASLSFLDNDGSEIGLTLPTTVILGTTTRYIGKMTTPLVFLGSGSFDGSFITQPTSFADIENKPIVIKDYYAGVSNYTGGNAANTLKVTVYYVVVDL